MKFLALKGAKHGLRFPKWQVTANGDLLPALKALRFAWRRRSLDRCSLNVTHELGIPRCRESLTVTRSSLRRFTLLLPREVCQNSWYERKDDVDYRSQLRSGKSAGRRGTTSGLAGGGHAPERRGPSEFRSD